MTSPPSLDAKLSELLVEHSASRLVAALASTLRPRAPEIAGVLDGAATTVARMEDTRARS